MSSAEAPSQHSDPGLDPGDAAAGVRQAVLGMVHVRDFRNLERIDLTVPASGFVVLGDNGHGKTKLLEPIG